MVRENTKFIIKPSNSDDYIFETSIFLNHGLILCFGKIVHFLLNFCLQKFPKNNNSGPTTAYPVMNMYFSHEIFMTKYVSKLISI